MYRESLTYNGIPRPGNEGRIIRINLVPCLVYCVIVVLVLGFWA